VPAETMQRLAPWGALHEAPGRDPVVRYDVGPAFADGWAVDGAVAFNAVARSLHLRLGYRVAHAWATRLIQPRR